MPNNYLRNQFKSDVKSKNKKGKSRNTATPEDQPHVDDDRTIIDEYIDEEIEISGDDGIDLRNGYEISNDMEIGIENGESTEVDQRETLVISDDSESVDEETDNTETNESKKKKNEVQNASDSGGGDNCFSSLKLELDELLVQTTITVDEFVNTSRSLERAINYSNVDSIDDDLSICLSEFNRLVEKLLISTDTPTYLQCGMYRRVVSILEYKVFRRDQIRPFIRYFTLKVFEKIIDEIITVHFPSETDPASIGLDMLKELEEIADEHLLLQLNKRMLQDLRKALAKLAHLFALNVATKVSAKRLDRFIEESIKPVIGYDPYMLEQKIYAEINPLNADYTRNEINLKTNSHQNNSTVSLTKGLLLTNYHIKSLELDLHVYGFSGNIEFTLSYDDAKFHKEYMFLYDNSPLSITLTLEYTYNFDDPDEKGTNYEKRLVLQSITESKMSSMLTLGDALIKDDVSTPEATIAAMSPTFSFTFHDPIKAYWQTHSPIYVDFEKNYLTILEDNLFFRYWVKIDSSKCKVLSVTKYQIFVNCHGRSFYDYFIEILTKYNIYLIYEYGLLKDNVATYSLLDSLEGETIDLSKDVDGFHASDIKQIQNIQCHITSPYKIEHRLLNITLSNKQDDVISIDNKNTINPEGLMEASLCSIDDQAIYRNHFDHLNAKESAERSVQYMYEIGMREVMPLVPFTPSYNFWNLKDTQWECSIANYSKNVYFSRQRYKLTMSSKTGKDIIRRILSQNYESDDEDDRYEKIAMLGVLNEITHMSSLKSTWHDTSSKKNILPDYVDFESINVEAEITIGNNVDESVKHSYKFYEGTTGKEISLEDDTRSSTEEFSLTEISEKSPCYSVTISEVFNRSSNRDKVIYVPVEFNSLSPNIFNPLRHGDHVLIRIESIEDVSIETVLTNTAVALKKGTSEIAQHQLYGPKQEGTIGYLHADRDQQLFIKQHTKDGKGYNELTFSNDGGVNLVYSDGEDE